MSEEKELNTIEKRKKEAKDREELAKKAKEREQQIKDGEVSEKEEAFESDKTIKIKLSEEKEKMSKMSFVEKLKYFKTYYLMKTVIIGAALICGLYFLFNNVIFEKKVVSSGCGVNVFLSQEIKDYLQQGYLEYLGDTNKRVASVVTDELFNEFGGSVQKLDGYSMEMVLYSQVAVGDINYFIMNENGYNWVKNQELCVSLDDVLSEETMQMLYEKDAVVNDDVAIEYDNQLELVNKNTAINLNKLGFFDENDGTAYLLFTIASPSEGYEESFTKHLLNYAQNK